MVKSTENQIYTGVATFGRVESLVSAIIASMLGAIFIIGGIFLIVHKPVKTNFVTGTVSNDPICIQYIKNNNVYNKCDIYVTYTINNITNSKNFRTDGGMIYRKGDNVNVYYNKSDYTDVALESDNHHILGVVLIIISIIFISIAWLWYYTTTKSKIAATATGVGSMINIARR